MHLQTALHAACRKAAIGLWDSHNYSYSIAFMLAGRKCCMRGSAHMAIRDWLVKTEDSVYDGVRETRLTYRRGNTRGCRNLPFTNCSGGLPSAQVVCSCRVFGYLPVPQAPITRYLC
jgi:hypothetical protein